MQAIARSGIPIGNPDKTVRLIICKYQIVQANGYAPASERQWNMTFNFFEGFEGGGAIESLTGVGGHVNFFLNLEEGEKLAKVGLYKKICLDLYFW